MSEHNPKCLSALRARLALCTPPHLLNLQLVGAAVNGPGGGPGCPAPVLDPVGDTVEALLQAVPVAVQPPHQAVEVLASCFHIHPPVVQITQTSPAQFRSNERAKQCLALVHHGPVIVLDNPSMDKPPQDESAVLVVTASALHWSAGLRIKNLIAPANFMD